MREAHLTREQEAAIVARARSGDRSALSALLASLDRLVISIARRFRGLGVDLDDLAQEGRIKVVHCATCPTAWEPGREARFSTYAMRAAEWRMVEVVLDAGAVVRVGRDTQRAAWREGGETRDQMRRTRRAVSGDAPRATGPLFERMPAGGESAERAMVRWGHYRRSNARSSRRCGCQTRARIAGGARLRLHGGWGGRGRGSGKWSGRRSSG